MGQVKSEHVNSQNPGKLNGFPKIITVKSLEQGWEKISKFLGKLQSKQMFHQNIPLGAPVTTRSHNKSDKADKETGCKE